MDMDNDKKKSNLIYFYPLIIFIFLVNFHYYQFYQDSFNQIRFLLKTKQKNLDYYEKIQSEHPYYEIWRLAKLNKNVIFLNESKSDKEIDYNTTYFKNINNKIKLNYYLSELKLFIDYYFFPKKIKTVSFRELVLNPKMLTKDDYLISDYQLEGYYKKLLEDNLCKKQKTAGQEVIENKFLATYNRLKRLEITKKSYMIVNRHPEKPYYLYQVIK